MALFRALINLLFPQTCLACEKLLVHTEKVLCTYCLFELPFFLEEKGTHELVAQHFWGDILIQQAAALFPFRKKSPLQKLIHKIKYQHRPFAMKQLGMFYGYLWKKAHTTNALDIIIPVPLHPKKLIKRGYNQSYELAKGMAHIMKLPCRDTLLQRIVYTSTQTKKSRAERLTNVARAFRVTKKAKKHLQGKNILLVDDLITTGSTLKACAKALLQANVHTINVAVLATAI